MNQILIDQEVAFALYQKEIAFFNNNPEICKSRGWEVLKADFPFFEIKFTISFNNKQINYLTCLFDLRNYNILPISVTITYPQPTKPGTTNMEDSIHRTVLLEGKNIMLNHHKLKRPFICIKGTYEYHTHDQHNKTYWDVYRYTGIGTLYQLVQTIWSGTTKNIIGFDIFRTSPFYGILIPRYKK